MILLGLTGGIGMGKSTTAKMFAEYGIAVWDADAAVHRLYARNGRAVAPMGKQFPSAIIDAEVSRSALKRIIDKDPSALDQISAIVHPLLAEDRAGFIETAQGDIALFDIPLLFETKADEWLDAVATVSVPQHTQIERVMERGTMTREQLDLILNRQMSDADRRAKADYIIDTSTLETATADVAGVVKDLRRGTHA